LKVNELLSVANPVNAKCPVDHEDEDYQGFGPFFDEQIWQHVLENALRKCGRPFQKVPIVFLLLQKKTWIICNKE